MGWLAGVARPTLAPVVAGWTLSTLAPLASTVPHLKRLFSSTQAAWHGPSTTATETTEQRVKKHLKDFKKLPWELDMPAEEAARVLGTHLGIPGLVPATELALDQAALTDLLTETTVKGNKTLEKAIFSYADAVTTKHFGDAIYYRGIVEFSNVCTNDCGYCGIRKHMSGVRRYTIPIPEVLEAARWAFTNRMGTLMLQAGELDTPSRMDYLLKLVPAVREATIALDAEQRGLDPQSLSDADKANMGLAVALSVGELSEQQYADLYAAGARRYLLRIETSNPQLYASLHPPGMSWEKRVECLHSLKRVGLQLGTGVMVGLPGQTLADLAGDLVFFRTMGANMIGMGPYITEEGTPVAAMWSALYGHLDKTAHMKSMFELTTRMNALARITLGSANIAATTALQAIEPNGREIALRRGANILMPILTPTKYREHYQLYEGKPCITDTADECRKCLNARVGMIGKRLRPGVWGDPPNFLSPVQALDVAQQRMQQQQQQQQQQPAKQGAARGYSTAARRSYHSSSAALDSPPAAMPSAAAADGAVPAALTRSEAVLGALGGSLPAGPAKGSDVPRINIGVFGCMNAGKSTLMNTITRQETSIVDSTPGTTADVKVSLMELHDIGPVKLFDTAGMDEAGALGDKKRRKTLGALKECDVALLVVDVARHAGCTQDQLQQSVAWERHVLEQAAHYQAVPLLLFNLKGQGQGPAGQQLMQRLRAVLDPQQQALALEMDLHGDSTSVPGRVASFLQDGITRSRKRPATRSLPDWALSPQAAVFLNIPMDAETPSMRLLRPQALVQEEAIRYWATTCAYRMDLGAARSGQQEAVERERARFMRALAPLLAHDGPKLLVTDSQAIDIVHPWTLSESGEELLPITTFSIAMIHRQSGGKLPLFVEGLRALEAGLGPGDKVLVAEACNHNRITDHCNDIGMVQIPRKLETLCGKGLAIEHAFGREFPEVEDGSLGGFKLALHCGGCMIDAQKMRARIADIEDAGVPITNYGLFLAWAHDPAALRRCLQPWGVSI